MGATPLKIQYHKLNEFAKEPTKGSNLAAGYDLYAGISEFTEIVPGETLKVTTGLSMEIPEGFFGGIFARSGLSINKGLRPANCVGVIDADYRGEIIVALHNDSNETWMIEPQMRIAQLILLPYSDIEFEVTGALTPTDRGDGGFGSTGQ